VRPSVAIAVIASRAVNGVFLAYKGTVYRVTLERGELDCIPYVHLERAGCLDCGKPLGENKKAVRCHRCAMLEHSNRKAA
jgi:hypothetical protein